MTTLKALLMLPLILIGYPIGFAWKSIRIGFLGGGRLADTTAETCAEAYLNSKRASADKEGR